MKAQSKSEEIKVKGFKDLSKITIPIVMKDRYGIDKLTEILESLKGLAYCELEDYIEQLQLIAKDFTSHISNNLKLSGMKEGIKEATESILDKIIILGNSTSEYNCHGWSFGCVRNIPLSSNKGNLPKEITIYKSIKEYDLHTDWNIAAFFSKEKPILQDNVEPNFNEGSVVAYYGKEKSIEHTARYTKSINNWYTYEKECYEEWYAKDRGVASFDESNTNCIVNSYTSKLGLGYLVTHDIKDLVPLYGEDLAFYDLQ